MIKMSMRVQAVKPRRLNASKVANDNASTMWSSLSWTEQRVTKRRIIDLEWQIRYATMQLNNWRDLDNGSWDSLTNMRDKAQIQLDSLMFG
ncbi:MAG: hypothetical protein ABJG88_12045 [Litorimonas sp.]